MQYCKGKITKLLTDYFGTDFRRITHALEVMKYAEEIMGKTEGFDYDIPYSPFYLLRLISSSISSNTIATSGAEDSMTASGEVCLW